MSVLLYGCTTWTLTRHSKKKLDGSNMWTLHTVLTKPWEQHPAKQLLYNHLPPISQTIQVRYTGQIHKWYTLMASYSWSYQCWQTKKNLDSSALCKHWMLSRGLAKMDGERERKSRKSMLLACLEEDYGKGMNLLIPISYGLNSTTTVLLQGWLWH